MKIPLKITREHSSCVFCAIISHLIYTLSCPVPGKDAVDAVAAGAAVAAGVQVKAAPPGWGRAHGRTAPPRGG